ncbi:RdgB/HAM1 family non-canonical purine NTP pyrophosphatase [Kocuria sp. cx-455]|uniref:RdgB/HAM1 family non-canonical purine NTP pyrophosphatase n=1 Tax=unclassified Candidatus Sulfotelmatobacter TaxID=2635724 RepID=UPI00168734EB|nr:MULTISPECIES: RdgB/HAM1 family non-canonical purine NTP pyrophosphatase [unclassified Candidatus Sulfotelmatobacter]MBD2761129.1 RdgB/HAM1 family non-canonical purine NTP pyrophosphatase [Kocuria sp. cx-116]MBD2764718.1 RdgB/HAM1 family non-canonical purine NTP pyrophosphatase [Kocuria sp. cx-455]
MSADPEPARIVLATKNTGKVRELQAMVAAAVPHLDAAAAVVDARTAGLSDVVEDGVSFAENALLKARAAVRETGMIALADDSGLAVDVMGGAPGIFSARWSGRHGDDSANLNLLLAQLGDVPDDHRGAHFVCAAAVVTPLGSEHVVLGELPGRILREPAGEHGFGYDPIFAPDGYDGLSCAQLTPEEKNRVSHRARAMKAVLPHLVAALGEQDDSGAVDPPRPASGD